MSIQARILLVDDESAIVENLASFLERSGFEVKTKTKAEEALPFELVARIRAVLRWARPGKPPRSAAWQIAESDLRFDHRFLQ
jgi:DNA-binding response OmpR family regulator